MNNKDRQVLENKARHRLNADHSSNVIDKSEVLEYTINNGVSQN